MRTTVVIDNSRDQFVDRIYAIHVPTLFKRSHSNRGNRIDVVELLRLQSLSVSKSDIVKVLTYSRNMRKNISLVPLLGLCNETERHKRDCNTHYKTT